MQTKMTPDHLLLILFLVCFSNCSDSSEKKADETDLRHSGLYIENGPRQGFQYFDSSGKEYNYRYYTITLTNDTTIPVRLELGFTLTEKMLSDTSNSEIFLLPRHLTPKQQQFDPGGMSKELKTFLDFEITNSVQLDKTIKPTEKCVLTFGVLTDRKFTDPTTAFATTLLPSNKKFKLKINDSLTIPCGQYSYIDK
jgi:hypothetical protein